MQRRPFYLKLDSERGSALASVLAFSTISMLMIASYLIWQYVAFRADFVRPKEVQATLSARSGLLLAVEQMNSDDQKKLESIALDADAFVIKKDSNNTPKSFLGASSFTPIPNAPACSVYSELKGAFLQIRSIALGFSRSIYSSAYLYGSLPEKKVPFIYTKKCPGKLKKSPDANLWCPADSISATKPLPLDPGEEGEIFKNRIGNKLTKIVNAKILLENILIQSEKDYFKLKDTISGNLILDGKLSPLTLPSHQKYYIAGDLQMTGKIFVNDCEFWVGKDAKIWDRSELTRVAIYAGSRIFFGDNSIVSHVKFDQSLAIAFDAIEVVGPSELENGVILISYKNGSGGAKAAPSILIRQKSVFDGVALVPADKASIKIFEETKCTGVLWARGASEINSPFKGWVFAETIVLGKISEENPNHAKEFLNSVQEGDSTKMYKLPYFMGKRVFGEWYEKR